MPLHLFNTLTRRVEPFAPLRPGQVTMYTCGPTVWNVAHIGNFRTFLFEDLLRRWLEASGLRVFHIMNLTDVDDRIIKEAGARGIPIREFTAPIIQAFFEDRDFLRIRPAHEYPRATDFVEPMVDLVAGLLASGTAYQGEDGSVYFAIERFPAYGRLSQLDRRELKAGASGRVSSDEYEKENAQDFALWKAARPEDEAVHAAWDAPFGRGRPGWHLECSAMALALLRREGLGDVLDIHAGGVDLIFPHHEDEIAQSCAYTGESHFARFWLHGEFLNVRGTKMSKRLGNITTPLDLRADGVDAGALRLLMFQTHYRKKMDLTDESLRASREGYRRIEEFRLRLYKQRREGGSPDGELDARAGEFENEMTSCLDDDLDAPGAIDAAFRFLRAANRSMDHGSGPGFATLESWSRFNDVFGIYPESQSVTPDAAVVRVPSGGASVGRGGMLDDESGYSVSKPWPSGFTLPPVPGEDPTVPLSADPPSDSGLQEGWASAWAGARMGARSRRDYKEADRIRDLLRAAGWEVRDNKDGTVEVRRA